MLCGSHYQSQSWMETLPPVYVCGCGGWVLFSETGQLPFNSLCSRGWPWTFNPPASSSWRLGLQAYVSHQFYAVLGTEPRAPCLPNTVTAELQPEPIQRVDEFIFIWQTSLLGNLLKRETSSSQGSNFKNSDTWRNRKKWRWEIRADLCPPELGFNFPWYLTLGPDFTLGCFHIWSQMCFLCALALFHCGAGLIIIIGGGGVSHFRAG